MSISRAITVLCADILLFVYGSALADTSLVFKDQAGKQTTVQVAGGVGRMQQADDSGYILFDSRSRTVLHVDPGRGSYMEMTEDRINSQMDQAAAMRRKMAPQLKMMKEQLVNVDPQTRKMIEQRMAGMPGMADAGSEPKVPASIKLVAKGRKTVAGLECQQHRLLQDGKHVADVCLIRSAGGKISRQDFQTLEATMGFFRKMASKAVQMTGGRDRLPALGTASIEGLPVDIRDLVKGNRLTLVSVSDGKLSSDLFTAYRKLKKQQMPGLPH